MDVLAATLSLLWLFGLLITFDLGNSLRLISIVDSTKALSMFAKRLHEKQQRTNETKGNKLVILNGKDVGMSSGR